MHYNRDDLPSVAQTGIFVVKCVANATFITDGKSSDFLAVAAELELVRYRCPYKNLDQPPAKKSQIANRISQFSILTTQFSHRISHIALRHYYGWRIFSFKSICSRNRAFSIQMLDVRLKAKRSQISYHTSHYSNLTTQYSHRKSNVWLTPLLLRMENYLAI